MSLEMILECTKRPSSCTLAVDRGTLLEPVYPLLLASHTDDIQLGYRDDNSIETRPSGNNLLRESLMELHFA